MGRKRTACQICADIKTLCSQGRPCTRCQRLSLPCTYEHDDREVVAAAAAQVARRPPKTGYTRSHRGCSECRRRRKKCDEQHPICGGCKRLRLDCVVLSSTSQVSETSGPSASIPLLSESAWPSHQIDTTSIAESHLPASPEWTSALADVFEDQLLSSQFTEWIALIEHEHRSGHEKRADLAHSAALVDLPVPCADDEGGLATFLPPTALNNLTGVTPFSLKNWTFGQRHLLNHFLQSVSRSLVVGDDEDNPFLRAVVPMVLESPMVRHGLLALSACHISRVYPVFQHDSLTHRSSALRILRAGIVDPDSLEYNLITTLLLCLAEVRMKYPSAMSLPPELG